MKSMTQAVHLLAALLLATVFTVGLAQAAGKTPSAKKPDTTAERATIQIGVPEVTLSVAKTGSGAGTVTSAPAGIDCGAIAARAMRRTLPPTSSNPGRVEAIGMTLALANRRPSSP
jgi:hypothetical protein